MPAPRTNRGQGAQRRARSSTAYTKARRELLRDQPLCHWCKRRPATEADHLIEVDRGGDDTLDNLVPACKQCNATRGANYKARKHNAQRPRVFGTPPALTPRPSFSLSPRNEPELVGSGLGGPRLETIVAGAVGSHGPAVADWAGRVLEVQLMPWQRHVLDAQLSYDADGNWCNRMALVSVARQNGKTVALKALVGWYLTEYAVTVGRPVTVLTTAHKLDLAVALFQELAPIMEAWYDAEVKWSYGRNQLTLGDHKWIVRAATPSAGHGQSCDLIVADELWDISSEALDVGLLPTQRAKPNPLCSMWSTAGTEASQAMLRWREQGLKAIDDKRSGALYFAEYSPPPQLDPMSPDAWAYANPALGYTIQPRTLELEAEAPNRAGFLRSSVNLWVQTDLAWLRPGLWHDLKTDDPTPPGGVIACETSLDDGRYVAVRAVPNASHVQVTVEFTAETQTAFWEQLAASCKQHPGTKVALSPTLDAQCPPSLNHRKVVVGFSEIVRYTQLVRNMILEGRVKHTGETQLAEHVGRAVAVRTQGALAISSQRSPGPIEMARCMVWAVAIVARPGWNVSRPAIASSLRRPA